MFRKAATLLAIALLALPLGVSAATTADVYRQSKDSVVLVMSYDQHGIPLALGSGFFFESKRIATNLHVVDGASRVVFKRVGAPQTAEIKRVARRSKSLDIAILETEEENPALKIASSDQTVVGQKVIAIGNPKGLEGSVSEGIISGKRELAEGISLLQITAPISPGSSGGPLFNESGEVIGITTATIVEGQNLNFAVPAHLIGEVLAAEGSYEPVMRAAPPLPRTGSAGLQLVDPEIPNQILGTVRYSLKNTTKHYVKGPVYLLIFRKLRGGEVVHYSVHATEDTIPPGLAKRYSSKDTSLQGYVTPDWPDRTLYGSNGVTAVVQVELRVLTYEIPDESAGADVLDMLAR